MKTSKPFSSISYNSIPFLSRKLNSFIVRGDIVYYEFIQHESDEDLKKPHIHLYIEPSKLIDTTLIFNDIKEPDITHPDKPLTCLDARTSKFGDWYWYVLHDKDYLISKGLTRNKFYTDENIISSDYDIHDIKVSENPLINYCYMSDNALRDYICECAYNGKSLQYIFTSVKVPLGKANSVIHFYNAIAPCASVVSKEFRNFPDMPKTKDRVSKILTGSAVPVSDVPKEVLF